MDDNTAIVLIIAMFCLLHVVKEWVKSHKK